ncbi:MAG: glutamyl-tRNA reductase [Propionibacteriaceae bacterium]
MSILIVSISHKTASMSMLARVAMDADTTHKVATTLQLGEHVDEAVVLSTCNRTEVYAAIDRFHGALDHITTTLADFTGVGVEELHEVCSVHFDEGAVAHAFGVVSGLDSMVVGENQILGQVRATLTAGQQSETVGTVLNSLLQQAIRVGKRVHHETTIGSAGRSMVTAAYDLLEAETGAFAGRRVLVVGAGSMASLAARTAAAAGAEVTCANRTPERARLLADSIGGRAVGMDQLGSALAGTDVVVTCTGARGLILSAEHLVGTPVRAVVDLALPADVADEVADHGITLINLARLLEQERDSATLAEVAAARDLVGGEVQDFLAGRRAAQVTPTVVALRTMASDVVAAELGRLETRVDLTERQQDEVRRTVRRVVEKLLHQPTVRVQELAADPHDVDYAAALRDLFALDPQAVAAVMSPEVRP